MKTLRTTPTSSMQVIIFMNRCISIISNKMNAKYNSQKKQPCKLQDCFLD